MVGSGNDAEALGTHSTLVVREWAKAAFAVAGIDSLIFGGAPVRARLLPLLLGCCC